MLNCINLMCKHRSHFQYIWICINYLYNIIKSNRFMLITQESAPLMHIYEKYESHILIKCSLRPVHYSKLNTDEFVLYKINVDTQPFHFYPNYKLNCWHTLLNHSHKLETTCHTVYQIAQQQNYLRYLNCYRNQQSFTTFILSFFFLFLF